MRLFSDDLGLETEVEWYYVPETRPVLPYFTPFRSFDWVLREDQPILGEVAGTRSYFAGQVQDDLNGLGLCGSREQWEGGASVLDPIRAINPTTGQPCCCGPGCLPFSPELVFDLENEVDFLPLVTGCAFANPSPEFYRLLPFPLDPGTCLDCAALGTERVLTNLAGTCRWTSGNFPWCTAANLQIFFDVGTPAGQVRMQFSGIGGGLPSLKAQYSMLLVNWDPFGANALDLEPATVSAHCVNWPATVTVEPSPPPP